MRPRSRPVGFLALSALLAASGCEEPRHVNTSGTNPPPSAPAPAPAPEPAPTPGHGFIVGQKTQDIRNADTELKSGNAQVASQKITARDPITLQGNAYVVAVGSIAINNIKHNVDIYQADNGRYPRDLKEFMDEIIKKNNIVLPVLPHYQEYAYDANEHKLIVLEYPDRKANPPKF
jgi:hypothetical protein